MKSTPDPALAARPFDGPAARIRRGRGIERYGDGTGEGAADHRLRLDPGEASCSRPTAIDAELQGALGAAMAAGGLEPYAMARGVGHNTAVSPRWGVPTGMVFLRNRNGCHSTDDAMRFEEFAKGVGG